MRERKKIKEKEKEREKIDKNILLDYIQIFLHILAFSD